MHLHTLFHTEAVFAMYLISNIGKQILSSLLHSGCGNERFLFYESSACMMNTFTEPNFQKLLQFSSLFIFLVSVSKSKQYIFFCFALAWFSSQKIADSLVEGFACTISQPEIKLLLL
jgi:hypothetical protein